MFIMNQGMLATAWLEYTLSMPVESTDVVTVIGRGTDHSAVVVRQRGDERGIDLDVGSTARGAAIDVVADDTGGAGMPCELHGIDRFLGRGEIDARDAGSIDRDLLDAGSEGVTGEAGRENIGSVGEGGETVITGAVSDG